MRGLYRQTVSSSLPSDNKTLDPSKDASAFSRTYDIKRETVEAGDVKGTYPVVPSTKVEIVPGDSTSNPKHIYLNISTQNTNTDIGIPAQFQIDFDQPFLKNTEKYYLSVVKATFPTTSVPLFEFNQGVYVISVTYPSAAFSRSIPIIPINIPQAADGNYYVYYYQQFLDSINNAIAIAFQQMKALTSFEGTYPPFLIKEGTRFALIAQEGYWNPNDLDGAILSINYTSYRLFNSLPSQTAPGAPGGETAFIVEDSGQQISTSQAVNPIYTYKMSNLIDQYWNQFHTYSQAMVVLFDTVYYACIANNTVGPQPDITPASWQAQGSTNPNVYDAGITYVQSQIVYYPDQNGVLFISLQYPNVGNAPDPTAPTAFWTPLPTGNPTTFDSTETYTIGQNVYYPNLSSGNIYINLTGTTGTNPSTDTTNWAANPAFNSYKMIGEYSSLGNWSDVESIVIQSSSLPVRYEIYGPPQGDLTSGSQVPRPVLTDLDPVLSSEGFDRSNIKYVPPGNYRMIDMTARDELRRIDANIQYKKKDLTFTDLILLPGDYFAIKFLFIRNDAFNLA